jgi:putative membrane protein
MAQPDDSPGTKSSINAGDSAFLKHAAVDGLAEVQMGQMALDKSSDAQVKQLAQRIVDDDTRSNEQLKVLAGNKQVTLPTAASSDALKEIGKLQKKNGSAFDQAWSKAIVKDHQFTHATLPTLQARLKSAQELAAVPDARDKAMDQATKSLANDPMSSMPATTAPTAASPAMPVPAPVAKH